jgi:vancomycin aglycone glucosyltransferase
MIEGTVAAQFETIGAAAEGCDIIVGATALQIAAPSIAERLGIPYVFAAYCPIVLPSRHHHPPVLTMLGQTAGERLSDYSDVWAKDAQRWNDTWRTLLDSHRASIGLTPVEDVHRHVTTAHPWLAADPTLGPWPDPNDGSVFRTGAWILRDDRPLGDELEAFLDDGDPPVYFGFGSVRAPENSSRTMIESARAAGRRAIVSRGWADLALVDGAPDCLSIGEVNQQALFTRVAAVVHHGGAGTTTAAARAGVPQVVIPQHYDQPYWAGRVRDLGIGAMHDTPVPDVDSLTAALGRALDPQTAIRAREVAASMRGDGATVAALEVLELSGVK